MGRPSYSARYAVSIWMLCDGFQTSDWEVCDWACKSIRCPSPHWILLCQLISLPRLISSSLNLRQLVIIQQHSFWTFWWNSTFRAEPDSAKNLTQQRCDQVEYMGGHKIESQTFMQIKESAVMQMGICVICRCSVWNWSASWYDD